MNYLAMVSMPVGIFSIILALVAIWLSVTYGRDAARTLGETRELMTRVDTRVEDIERYTRDQTDRMLTHIMELGRKEATGADMTHMVDVLNRIKGTRLEGVFMQYLEQEMRRKKEDK